LSEPTNNQRRKMRRPPSQWLLSPVRFRIHLGHKAYWATPINYHFRGACIRLETPPAMPNQEAIAPQGRIDFYLGKKCIEKNIPFRLAWERLEADGIIGIEFLRSVHRLKERTARYLVHRQYTPLITAVDPLDVHRSIYFKSINLSEKGALLSTSLSNKHLFRGMELPKSQLSFPGMTPIRANLKVRHARHSKEEGSFLVGVSIESQLKEYRKCLSNYLTVLSPFNSTESRITKLRGDELLSTKVKNGLTFRCIQTQEDYEQLLKLRHLGFSLAKKVKRGSVWQDQGEGLEKEGMLVCGFLAGEMVSGMELRFGNHGVPLSIIHKLHGNMKKKLEAERICEVSRLVVHPSGQGSDAFVGLIQKVHAILFQAGGYDALICVVDDLVHLYRRLGFREVGSRFPHPHISNVYLRPMLIEKKIFVRAQNINAYNWSVVYSETHAYLEKIGLADKLDLSSLQKAEVAAGKSVQWLMRKFKPKKKTAKKKRGKPDSSLKDAA